MRHVVAVAVVASLAAGPRVASAEAERDPWYRGAAGRHRVVHLSLAVGLGTAYALSESAFKTTLAPDGCRWCDPPGFDRRVRDALVWDDYERAQTISDVTGYALAPTLALGLTTLAAVREDASWGRVLDDVLPVLETVAISQAVTQVVKYGVGRARPLARFRSPPAGPDDNLSFFSGHSALVFGLAVSAGVVAHHRRSPLEPVIWGGGLALAATTVYLRMAGDKHYLSDVLVGSTVGVVSGLVIPGLVRFDGPVSVVPAPGGVAVLGTF